MNHFLELASLALVGLGGGMVLAAIFFVLSSLLRGPRR